MKSSCTYLHLSLIIGYSLFFQRYKYTYVQIILEAVSGPSTISLSIISSISFIILDFLCLLIVLLLSLTLETYANISIIQSQ